MAFVRAIGSSGARAGSAATAQADAWLREGNRDALPGSNTLVDATMDELQSILQSLGIVER